MQLARHLGVIARDADDVVVAFGRAALDSAGIGGVEKKGGMDVAAFLPVPPGRRTARAARLPASLDAGRRVLQDLREENARMKTLTAVLGIAFAIATAQFSFAQAAVSDADIETFAAIYVDLLDTATKAESELQAAKSEEEAQQIRTRVQSESVEKVAKRGWTPEKFNSVGDAINADPALTEKAVKLIEAK